MPYKLYGSPLSPYMRAAQIVFAEHDIEYELVPIGPAELAAPDYGNLHPYRKLPTLDYDGERVFETSAIMHYIDALSDTPLQPGDPLQAARSNQWLSAANCYIYRDAFTNLYFKRVLAPQFGIEVDEDVIADGVEKSAGHLIHVEHAIAAGELGGAAPHLGDILVGSVLILLRDIEEGRRLLEPHPRTTAWLNDLSVRPSFVATNS
ncbi:MAG: glutathione S-transferase family protein [Pseudomonadota bacterium]